MHPLGDGGVGAGFRKLRDPGWLSSAGEQLSRARECGDEQEERRGEESYCQIPSSPFLI